VNTSLYNISPIDGRYRSKTSVLSEYFSEFALIKTRIEVEIEYLIALSEFKIKGLDVFSEKDKTALRSIYLDFNLEQALEVKELESTINHDVKAVEYFIKKSCDQLGISFNAEFIHFGLTSQDINNTAFPVMLMRYLENLYIPNLNKITESLEQKAQEWSIIPLLARTHGQPASPTTLGKEIYVFVERLRYQIKILEAAQHSGKFGGATGNFNAHVVAYPDRNWNQFGAEFLKKLGLVRQKTTTQIEHYDQMAHILDTSKRIHNILIDFSKDVWSYVSLEIFTQKINTQEVGSSAMPHKVNPIDFENAEGNLMYANAILEFLASKLPISRLQRDLTDSTVLRNIGVPYAHAEVAFASLTKGIHKLNVNSSRIEEDLEQNWIVIAEAIQTILRREGVMKPYELLKDFSRTNQKPNKAAFKDFIETLPVSNDVKEELKAITPQNYIGYRFNS
jgi:adenylosuccinate lyase